MNEKSVMKTVLLLCPFFRPNIGGVETTLNDITKYLRTHNHNVFVITYKPLTTRIRNALSLEKKENLEIHRLRWIGFDLFHKLEPYPLLQFFYLTPWLAIYTFVFMLKHNKEINVIHAHGLAAAFIAKILSKIFKKRSIVSTHAIYSFKHRPLLARAVKWILLSFDHILPLSERSKEELSFIGIPEEKMTVAMCWVNGDIFKTFDKKKCKETFGLGEKFIVLFVGRFIEIKGINLLLEASKSVGPDVKILFIGNGPLADRVKFASKGTENLLYIGKVSRKELCLYYNAADVVIVPSQYEEGFGRVIIEALACATPVIASNVGGIPEVIDSSVGVLIEPTVESVVEQINFFREHPDELRKMQENCREYALKHFGEKNIEKIINSYNEVEI